MKQNQAAVFISRINPTERESVIRILSKKREWPGEASEGIEHYIKALPFCIESELTSEERRHERIRVIKEM
jgi:hypothetical protein